MHVICYTQFNALEVCLKIAQLCNNDSPAISYIVSRQVYLNCVI